MNERIKELLKQAQVYAYQQWLEAGYPSWENYKEVFAEDYNKKFAELIIAECDKVIFETPVDYMEIDTMHRIRDSVKEHFGVKE